MKSKAYRLTQFFLALSAFLCLATALFAEEQELPKSGMLSETITGTHDSLSVPGPWGGLNREGGAAAPVSGSVSRASAGQWIMRLFNNSGESYNVDVAVVQYDRMGKSVKRDSFSYSLRPNQSVDRSVSSTLNSENAALELIRWKKVGGKDKPAAGAPKSAEAPVSAP